MDNATLHYKLRHIHKTCKLQVRYNFYLTKQLSKQHISNEAENSGAC
jgi:hypothetical protein